MNKTPHFPTTSNRPRFSLLRQNISRLVLKTNRKSKKEPPRFVSGTVRGYAVSLCLSPNLSVRPGSQHEYFRLHRACQRGGTELHPARPTFSLSLPRYFPAWTPRSPPLYLTPHSTTQARTDIHLTVRPYGPAGMEGFVLESTPLAAACRAFHNVEIGSSLLWCSCLVDVRCRSKISRHGRNIVSAFLTFPWIDVCMLVRESWPPPKETRWNYRRVGVCRHNNNRSGFRFFRSVFFISFVLAMIEP